jgi:hypothetical protein
MYYVCNLIRCFNLTLRYYKNENSSHILQKNKVDINENKAKLLVQAKTCLLLIHVKNRLDQRLRKLTRLQLRSDNKRVRPT